MLLFIISSRQIARSKLLTFCRLSTCSNCFKGENMLLTDYPRHNAIGRDSYVKLRLTPHQNTSLIPYRAQQKTLPLIATNVSSLLLLPSTTSLSSPNGENLSSKEPTFPPFYLTLTQSKHAPTTQSIIIANITYSKLLL